MEHHTVQQRIEIIRCDHQSSLSVRAMFRARREIYDRHHRPTEGTIRRIVDKFETTGSVTDQPTPVHRRNTRLDEDVAAVRESVSEDPNLSIACRAQELGLSRTSTWRILLKNLDLFSYNIQLTQELKPNDHFHRRQFANCTLEQLVISLDFGKKKIIFSDEAHFWINGFVNKQDCRIWDEHNPQEIQQRSLHSEKVTVCCGFWSGSIIGPYFFQNKARAALTVTGERYTSMITDSFLAQLG